MIVFFRKSLSLFAILMLSCVIISGGCGGSSSTKVVEKVVYIEVEKEEPEPADPIDYITDEEKLSDDNTVPIDPTVIKGTWKIISGDGEIEVGEQKIPLEYESASAESFDITITLSDDVNTTDKTEYDVNLSGDNGVFTWSDVQYITVDFKDNGLIPDEYLEYIYIKGVVALAGTKNFVKKIGNKYVYTHNLSEADEKAFSTYQIIDENTLIYEHMHYKGSTKDTKIRFKIERIIKNNEIIQ